MAGNDAWRFQQRDRLGQWAGGFSRRVTTNRAENIASRGASAGAQAKTRRARLAALGELHSRAMAGDRTLTRRELDQVEYASPKLIQKSRRERGTAVMPRAEAFARERGRRNTARDVKVNPLTGKFVTERALRRRGGSDDSEAAPFSRRSKSGASAARAKLAPKPPKKPSPAKPTAGSVQTDKGTYISREDAARIMFGDAEAARRLAKAAAKRPARAKLAPKPEYVGRRRADP